MASLHKLSIPPLIRGIQNTTAILHKALASGIDPAVLLAARIHPTMNAFPFQIFTLTRMATSVPPTINPSLAPAALPDLPSQPTFDALFARLDAAAAYLSSINPDDLNGREEERVSLRIERAWAGDVASVEFEDKVAYVGQHAHPYFWFHVVAAYALLRGEGVELGKMDFLNAAGGLGWRFEKV